MKDRYCSFVDTCIEFDSSEGTFDIIHDGKARLSNCCFIKDGKKISFKTLENHFAIDCSGMKITSEDGEILIVLKKGKLTLNVSKPMTFEAVALGDDLIATSRAEHKFFRSSYGYAANALDDTLFDRQNDFAITIDGEVKRFFYSFEKSEWQVFTEITEKLSVTFSENVYSTLYGVNYSPINKNTTFKKPPVGWMTWYAVKFDASEKTVLENARWLSENLKKYGANSVWVDWEWYHKDMKGVRDDGCDVFHPDPEKYPNGLKFVSDEIRNLGLVPCLWMGVCTDPGENDFIKEHPEAVLLHQRVWCGQYFFDFTHPEFLNNFLPRALGQVSEWGYEAVKMDTLPNGINFNEEYRLRAYDPKITTREAYRRMIKKSREILGKDCYMLSCAGGREAVVLWTGDIFDAARIGDDVFAWESFIKQAVGCTAYHYPFHNVMFLNDADNLIVREEFNTLEQAKSRAAFISLLGLPVTFGDNLPELSEERVELLKRSIPALDIHSSEINRFFPDKTVTTCLSVQTEWDAYNVVSLFNTSDEETEAECIFEELGIESGNKLVFEFWSKSFEKTNRIKTTLAPFETKVYAVREDKGVPTIVSTSRHITQGALELAEIVYDNKTLSFVSELVENDPYTVSVYIPDGYTLEGQEGFDTVEKNGEILRLTVLPKMGGKKKFEIKFKEN